MLSRTQVITPERLRKRSVQYEPALFARSVFSQEARTIIHAWGNRKGIEWEINDQGYRGPYFETKKPDGVTRILVYGGSAVFDSRNTRGEDWPHRVQGKLSTAKSAKFEVINAGIMGHTALESVGRLFTEGHVFEPDYVLLYNAWNDIKYFDSKKTILRTLKPTLHHFDPRIHYRNGVDRWLCEVSLLYTLVRRIYYKRQFKIDREGVRKAGNTQLPISALNPQAFRQYRLALEVFVDLARNIGAEPILLTQARLVHAANTPAQKERIDYHHVGLTHDALVETFDRLDAIVRAVATQKGATMIDASAALSGKDWAFYDHVHLSPQGSAALAQLIVDRLQPVLKLSHGTAKQPNRTDTAASAENG